MPTEVVTGNNASEAKNAFSGDKTDNEGGAHFDFDDICDAIEEYNQELGSEENQRILMKKKFAQTSSNLTDNANERTRKKKMPTKSVATVNNVVSQKTKTEMRVKSFLQQERYLDRRHSNPDHDISSLHMTSVETMNDRQGKRLIMPEVSVKKDREARSAKPGYRGPENSKLAIKPTLERFKKVREVELEQKANVIQNKLYYQFKIKMERQQLKDRAKIREYWHEEYQKLLIPILREQ